MKRALLPCALALATAVSSLAAWREVSCSACGRGGIPLGLMGAAFYSCALITTMTFGLRRPVALALFGALGLHLGLVGVMASRGPFCPTCLLAAGASALVTASLLARDRSLADPAVAIVPWGAAAAFLLPLHPAARDIEIPSTAGAPVQISIYSWDGCRYCEQLRDEVLPEALAGLQDQVDVRWLAAPPSSRVPAIILSRAGRTGGRYIEGLTPPGFLREEINKLLAVTP